MPGPLRLVRKPFPLVPPLVIPGDRQATLSFIVLEGDIASKTCQWHSWTKARVRATTTMRSFVGSGGRRHPWVPASRPGDPERCPARSANRCAWDPMNPISGAAIPNALHTQRHRLEFWQRPQTSRFAGFHGGISKARVEPAVIATSQAEGCRNAHKSGTIAVAIQEHQQLTMYSRLCEGKRNIQYM